MNRGHKAVKPSAVRVYQQNGHRGLSRDIKSMPKNNQFKYYGKQFRKKTQDALENESDYGTTTVSYGIKTAHVSKKTFKTAQFASPHIVKGVKEGYNASVKSYKYVSQLNTKFAHLRSKPLVVNAQTLHTFRKFAVKAALNTKPVVKVKESVDNVRRTVSDVKSNVQRIHRGTKTTYQFTADVLNGRRKLTRDDFNSVKHYAFQAGKWSKGKVSDTLVSSAKRVRVTSKFVGKGVLLVGDRLSESSDTGTQSLGLGIKSAKVSIDIAKATPKIVKKTVSGFKGTSYMVTQTNRKIVGVSQRVAAYGFKNTTKHYQLKAAKAVYNAGGSAVSAAIHGLRSVGVKFVLPLVLIVVIVVAMFNAMLTPISSIGVVFGGAFSNKDTGESYDVHEYLLKEVDPRIDGLVDKIIRLRDRSLVQNGGRYHFVKLFTATDSNEIDMSRQSIVNSIYTTEETVNLIEPFFQTILLMKYDLEPTQSQIDDSISEIWNSIFKLRTSDLPIEYCEDTCSSCGKRHSVSGCPNYTSGTHRNYTCSRCCNESTDDEGDTHNSCDGYTICKGHRGLAITIDLDGYYELLKKYFTDDIDRLANMPTRTEAQEQELKNLKDNYQLCLAYMDIVLKTANNGLGDTDMTGVVFVDGDRPKNENIVSVAAMQLGNVGGQPFWSWYGFGGRVEWCATFVSWCANSVNAIGKVPKFASCREGTRWFKERNQWATNYNNPVAGDIIFFDWDMDGQPNHVGIVVGSDRNKVYTIEGNSGDVCRRRSYTLQSRVILGYGLPNY